MHKITIDGLDWTSKDEISINGVVYIKKEKAKPTPPEVHCRIIGVKPAYGENGLETLGLVLESAVQSLKMPINCKNLRPGDYIVIQQKVKK